MAAGHGHVLCTATTTMAEASLNLMVARGPDTGWDLQTQTSPYDQERWFAAAWGSALTMLGARRGGFSGGLLATLGATVNVRAAMGRHDFAMARHWTNTNLRRRGWLNGDVVHEASDEAFPAGDSPWCTPTAGRARR